jgi:glycosyltransferase involved in cell wall biosynthesis
MTNVLILHDSVDFGGHERMFLNLLPALDAARFKVTACVPATNTKLVDAIGRTLPHCEIRPWRFVKRRGEPYLRYFRWRYRRHVRGAFATIRPDVVLLVQGRIENLAVPLSALPKAARIVSYLPMAHQIAEMRRGDIFGDRARRGLYRRPNGFIVPSPEVAGQLRRAGGMAPVFVVENVVDAGEHVPQELARQKLDLPLQGKIAIFMGRLEPRQKGLDILLAAMRRADPTRLSDWTFMFVGEGPGKTMLRDAARRIRLDLKIIAWTDQPNLYLSASNVLLLPSRWEGLPLVMLEALQHGLPMLASDIDVYRASLPDCAIVDFSKIDLAAALERAIARDEPCAGDLEMGTVESARIRFSEAVQSVVSA